MYQLLSIINYQLLPDLPEKLVVGLYSESESIVEPQSDPDFQKSKLLISNLMQDANIELNDYTLTKYPGGKPYLKSSSSCKGVSISHTNQMYLVGVNSNGEIGIDLESMDRKTHKNLSDRIKNEHDRYLTSISTLQIWTIKEAILKLTGTGLRTNMNKIALCQKSTRLFHVFHDNLDISIVSFQHSGYWISIAWTEH